MQIGRRRRDDYTDGTIRIPIESAPQKLGDKKLWQ
jgi:hypothetical protein